MLFSRVLPLQTKVNMHPKRLEQKLKEIDPLFNIHRHNHIYKLNDGIYLGNKRICAIPSGFVWVMAISEHKNMHGVIHRSLEQLNILLIKRGLIRPWQTRVLLSQ